MVQCSESAALKRGVKDLASYVQGLRKAVSGKAQARDVEALGAPPPVQDRGASSQAGTTGTLAAGYGSAAGSLGALRGPGEREGDAARVAQHP